MSSALGFPDFQRITQWFGRPLAQAAAAAIGAGQIVVGPLDVRTFASVVVCVKPTGGTVTVTVDQLVPGGPAALVVSSAFVVNDGNVIFEAFVLLAGEVRVTFQGSAPGEVLAYAIVPANTNTNAEVAALTQLGFQHNDLVVATETAIDLEDDARIGFTFLDDPANLRMKITPVLRQNGAVTGSLYRWDGTGWTPTAGIIADDALRKITFGGDATLYRTAANQIATDGEFWIGRGVSSSRLIFGPADVNLYRSAASQGKMDSALTIGPVLTTPAGGVGGTGGAGVLLDPAGRINAIRAADGFAFAASLSADTFVRTGITTAGLVQWGIGTSTIDTSLYRYAAGELAVTGAPAALSLYDARDATAAGGALRFRTNVGATGNIMAALRGTQVAAGANPGQLDIDVNNGAAPSNVARVTKDGTWLNLPHKAGIPTDADLPAGLVVPSGAGPFVLDETNNRLYVRLNSGTWKYAALV